MISNLNGKPDLRTKIETPENDNKILKTVCNYKDRIKTKRIYKINKYNSQLSYKRKKDAQ